MELYMKIDYVKLVEAELSCIIRMGGSRLCLLRPPLPSYPFCGDT